jgi:hypothetical protein
MSNGGQQTAKAISLQASLAISAGDFQSTMSMMEVQRAVTEGGDEKRVRMNAQKGMLYSFCKVV